MPELAIDVVNRQSHWPIDADRLAAAARRVLLGEGLGGQVSIAVLDDAAIHELNRRHLGHDYPTDVLSFLLDRRGERIEGDLAVSAEHAAAVAPTYRWPAGDELLLYVVHGCLHLAGHDDRDDAARAAMRRLEDRYLAELGLTVPRVHNPRRRCADSSRDSAARACEATP